MKTAREVIRENGIKFDDLISSSTMDAMEKAINAARKEAIEECAKIIKDDLTEEFATQTVNRVLKLIDELK